MRASSVLLAGLAVAMATSVQAAGPTRAERGQAAMLRALDGRYPGPPVDCITLSNVDSSEILDGTGILYRMRGGTYYLNRPTSAAQVLRRDQILVSRTLGARLCRMDIVRLVESGGGFPAGAVGLGVFTPYLKPKAEPRR